ncbi:BRCA1-associated protein [Artemisia annua]|uniref:BRCA1-associated protein n=1 Tax=Artemisia annua TaxID=35608 RepID=A0A2U1MIU4_ARTAN|nr:BRCA1-associated protein [Artemisia annua]
MGRSQKYLYGIRVEVDDSRTLLPFDTSVIKPFCYKAADAKEYDSLRSDFPNRFKELGYYDNDTQSNESPRRVCLTGKVHLFRSIPKIDDKKYKAPEDNLALLLGVPSILDYENFIQYCTRRCTNVSDVYFIRNLGEPFYSVLAKLPTVKDAELFYDQMHYGKYHMELRFGPVYLLHKAEYMNITCITRVPWSGYRVLPSCYLCLELLNADATDIQNQSCRHLVGDQSNCKCNFRGCLSCEVWNPHEKPNADIRCRTCKEPANLLCLICGSVFCGSGQAQTGHAFYHYCRNYHAYVFEINTRRIYDYLENSCVKDRVLLLAESSLQRNLDAMDVEADKEVVTEKLAVHDDISLEAKEDENEDDPAPPDYLAVSTRNPDCEEDILALEDDDAQRKAQEQDLIKAQEQDLILAVATECDKKIAYWKDLEIELASAEKKKLDHEILSKQEEAQKLRRN